MADYKEHDTTSRNQLAGTIPMCLYWRILQSYNLGKKCWDTLRPSIGAVFIVIMLSGRFLQHCLVGEGVCREGYSCHKGLTFILRYIQKVYQHSNFARKWHNEEEKLTQVSQCIFSKILGFDVRLGYH